MHKIIADFASECQLFFQFDFIFPGGGGRAPNGLVSGADYGAVGRKIRNFGEKTLPFSPVLSAKGGKFRRKKRTAGRGLKINPRPAVKITPICEAIWVVVSASVITPMGNIIANPRPGVNFFFNLILFFRGGGGGAARRRGGAGFSPIIRG